MRGYSSHARLVLKCFEILRDLAKRRQHNGLSRTLTSGVMTTGAPLTRSVKVVMGSADASSGEVLARYPGASHRASRRSPPYQSKGGQKAVGFLRVLLAAAKEERLTASAQHRQASGGSKRKRAQHAGTQPLRSAAKKARNALRLCEIWPSAQEMCLNRAQVFFCAGAFTEVRYDRRTEDSWLRRAHYFWLGRRLRESLKFLNHAFAPQCKTGH